MSRLYLWLASTRLGGFHEWWPLYIMIHDRGISAGWRRIERMRIGQ